LIADQEIVPEYSQNGYTEKIVYLPNSYQVNDTKRQISDLVLQRSSVGLPESSFVFCSFNNSYKIMPKTFEIWMNILKNVDKSVLWLLADNELMKENIHKEAQRLGVIKDRIIFSSRQDLPDHLARHRLADIFLDTWPCNAHTTCSDALWVGLPVLTLIGESFASRVGASLLKAIGLEEMIMHTPETYQMKAIELGNNPNKVKIIKEKLMSNISSAPLFDIHLYVQHIEMAFRKMYEIYQNDQPPQNIYPNDYLTTSNFVK
jgi:predicted O-linked N-acetylglucosamine transferase (SPINDLY family)